VARYTSGSPPSRADSGIRDRETRGVAALWGPIRVTSDPPRRDPTRSTGGPCGLSALRSWGRLGAVLRRMAGGVPRPRASVPRWGVLPPGVRRLPAELVHPLTAGGLIPRAVDGARRPAFDREPSEAPGPRAGGGLPDGPGRASCEDLGVPRVHVAGRQVAAYQHQAMFDRTVILARSSARCNPYQGVGQDGEAGAPKNRSIPRWHAGCYQGPSLLPFCPPAT
jgi:hypothetical protein